jgi:hypothetical protein
MPHHTPLISTIVGGIVLAFIFGALAQRVRISPLVGYLLAGVAVGPSTPGFVADPALAGDLAEIGVILLMFGVGLHFSLEDLLWQARQVDGATHPVSGDCGRFRAPTCRSIQNRRTRAQVSSAVPWFAPDSALEGNGFEISVPRQIGSGFEASVGLGPIGNRRGGITRAVVGLVNR